MALTIALATLIIITSFKTAEGKLGKDDLCLRIFYECAEILGVSRFINVDKKLEHDDFCYGVTRSLDCLAEKDSKPKLKTIEERITVYDECYGVEFATFKKKDMKIYRLYKNTCRPSVAFALGMEGCSE
ncbi:unnamed protein product [Thelazia callipaeda]|uniref:DUF19 domain-containing protein n=1 Tax=Thelazia callipaeda TaxID=103827 RepID=A0A0N5CTG2_THECL|nr:unnamed protein product [Thelazia callipaeda]